MSDFSQWPLISLNGLFQTFPLQLRVGEALPGYRRGGNRLRDCTRRLRPDPTSPIEPRCRNEGCAATEEIAKDAIARALGHHVPS